MPKHREWWPYGRHAYKAQEPDTGICKACNLPKESVLHTVSEDRPFDSGLIDNAPKTVLRERKSDGIHN
jgi:hypothetical protein